MIAAHEAAANRAALASLEIPTQARQRLAQYLDKLAQWSPRVNLTGARTAAERVALLVAPVVAVAPLVGSGRLLDIGSGNGSPGLVLGLLREDLAVTLLEPRTRRWAFLREAARAAGRPEIEIVRQRHEDYRGEPAQTLTVRGLRLELCDVRRLVRVGGELIVFGAEAGGDPAFERLPTPTAWSAGVQRYRRRDP